MSIWSNIAKMAGGAAKGTWGFAKAGGRSLGNTVIHPAQTLKGAGSAMKTAAVGVMWHGRNSPPIKALSKL